jgi:Fe-S-cluster containining protein
MTRRDFDCQSCGACCVNAKENIAEGVHHWVAIESNAVLWQRKDLVKKLVCHDEEGRPHLRLDLQHRCMALHGRIGDRVTCSIYNHRPQGCRKVQPGDRECLRSRADWLQRAPESSPKLLPKTLSKRT